MRRLSLSLSASLFLGLGAVLMLASQPRSQTKPPVQTPDLPGITAPDKFAKGCVSCHVKLAADKDFRLVQAIKLIKGHPSIAAVKTVPNDCRACHSGKPGAAKPLSEAVHKAHFGKKGKSEFVSQFHGQCLSCHSIDPATGKQRVKSGPKNW
ncbi:MAG: hypothetical protein KJZ62_08970 [Fimbriimonadaceae bacterium]|nr:hypothetical protein [Fimbriimonadaceae bacterium]QOJ11976.1 MAG: hypothetical protein HRU74_07900 [Chthonomonadaceae bacterium]